MAGGDVGAGNPARSWDLLHQLRHYTRSVLAIRPAIAHPARHAMRALSPRPEEATRETIPRHVLPGRRVYTGRPAPGARAAAGAGRRRARRDAHRAALVALPVGPRRPARRRQPPDARQGPRGE